MVSSYIFVALLSCALAYFIFALVAGMKKGKGSKKTIAIRPQYSEKNAQQGDINVTLRKEDDGIHIILPADIEEDDDDIFPDIVNNIPPDTKGIKPSDCYNMARLPEITDPSERERIVRVFADAGIISEEDVSRLAMLSPYIEGNPHSESEEKPESDSGNQATDPASTDDESSPQNLPQPEVGDPIPEPIPDSSQHPAPTGGSDDYEFNI